MSSRPVLLLLLAGLALSGCQTTAPTAPPAPPDAVMAPPGDSSWRGAIRDADMDRLERLDAAWSEGLAEVRGRGFARQIGVEGALLMPDGGLPRAALPPGSYRCRLIRLGAGPRRAAYTAYPSFFCHVGAEDDLIAFTKQTGSERPAGYIWADGDRRGVFLGAMSEGEASPAAAYGQDAARDMVGIVERVGAFRYRLLLPWPQNGAKIDVLELIPAVPEGD